MFKSGIIGAFMIGMLTAFIIVVPSKPNILAYAAGTGSALIIIIHFITTTNPRKKRTGRAAFWIPLMSLSTLFIVLPAFFAATLYVWGMFSVIFWILLISLTVVFYVNFVSVPLAIYQKRQELKQIDSLSYFPSISILIPAYNEEKVLRRSIDTVLEASYPDHKKEVIVIDDGSTDKTYQIAQEFHSSDVKVIRRPNGGKAVAINHGLQFARGEVIIVVDADSLVGKNTLLELVQPFKNPEVVSVAGNIKVLNRMNLLTKCQALEYITAINIFRRALAVFGGVTVVPGALGAYRREVLEGSGFYDPDTIVEDFDVTIKTLKTGKVIQASTAAIAYTEAPQTLDGFMKQRLRWYRGNFQTLWKHHDAAFNARYGFLQKLVFPFLAISTVFLPFADLTVVISVILALASGVGIMTVPAILYFTLLQLLLFLLAIDLDNEDKKLVLFTPLFIFGYKQLCTFTMIKSLVDVLFRRKLKWTSAQRTGAEVSRSALS
jgi:cellulose synthase/poly-beta-1,6-N-acetylglucosamine synthase-like glycosyltransferase